MVEAFERHTQISEFDLGQILSSSRHLSLIPQNKDTNQNIDTVLYQKFWDKISYILMIILKQNIQKETFVIVINSIH
jgi:hypothetical protein